MNDVQQVFLELDTFDVSVLDMLLSPTIIWYVAMKLRMTF